ncbi:MAG: hypothetical protein MUE51_13390 [Thermoleophilia bacterium]|jgi:hypothetical protein|nr:hypothetical protein [Thermoleophilia bacterium]
MPGLREPIPGLPRLSAEEEHLLQHPEEGFPADASFDEVDAEQFHQGAILERDKQWIDRREVTGGDD